MNWPYPTLCVPPERPACQVRIPEGPACRVRFSRRDVLVTSAVQLSMINSLCPGTTSVPLRTISRRDLPVRAVFRRDPPVGSAVQRWIVHSVLPGTEVPRGKRG